MATDVNDLRVETLAKEQYLKPAQRAELQENIARDEAYLQGQGPNGQPLAHVPGFAAVMTLYWIGELTAPAVW